MTRSPFRTDRSGTAALEFIFVLPVLMICLAGVFETTEWIRVNMKVSHTTQLLGRMIARQIDPLDLGKLCKGAAKAMAPFPVAPFAASVASVSNRGGASQDWENHNSCPAGAPAMTDAVQQVTQGPNLVPDNNDTVIAINTSYTYVPLMQVFLRWVIGDQKVVITKTGYFRPRLNQPLSCANC